MNLVRAQVVPGGTMKQNLRPILVVFLTVVLDLVGFGIFIPLMSYYAEAFSASPTQVTLLMAVYSVMSPSYVLVRQRSLTAMLSP